MRLRQVAILMAVAWLISAGAMAAAPKVMYVQVPKAEVRDGKAPGSAVVAELNQGTKLTVLTEEGVRYSVQLEDGRKGYISKLAVSADKPSSGGGLGGLALTDDRDINERRSAASGRGLSEAAKTMAKGTADPKVIIAWVEAMEKLGAKISAADVKQFRKEGGLQ
ncbi:MAG: SH3 domain-containing protein [bacterium]